MCKNFNDINAHPRDCRISFEPISHVYTATCADGSLVECKSVTTVVGDFFEKFDADYWANRKATPFRTAEMIKAEWERKGQIARDLGTQLHDWIERFYLGEAPQPEALADKAFSNFLAFAKNTELHPYRSEWRIFSEKYRVAGTLDFLVCSPQGVYEIYDWKRSSKLLDSNHGLICSNSFGKTGRVFLSHIPDTTYHHYALQLSLYRYILEEEYGICVSQGHLGIFHPDYNEPVVKDVPYYRNEAQSILQSMMI